MAALGVAFPNVLRHIIRIFESIVGMSFECAVAGPSSLNPEDRNRLIDIPVPAMTTKGLQIW